MKTAIQLYTLRNRLSEGVEKVLKEIREMGYEGVEWYYLPDNSPEKAAELSKAAGLEIFSAHIDINIVLAGDRELLKRLAKAGFKYLPIGWLPQERLAGGPLFAETCDAIRTYAEMAMDVAAYVGIPSIDAGSTSMINQYHPDYLADQIHHSELGGKQYALTIWMELKDIPPLLKAE